MFGKLSIVVFLLRVMGQAKTRAKTWFLYGISIVQIILNIEAIIVVMGFCVPAQKIWNPKIEGWCMSPTSQEIGGLIQACTVPALTPLFTTLLRKPSPESYDISGPYRGRKNSGYVAYQGNDAFSSRVHTSRVNKGVVGSTVRSKAEDEESDGANADASSVDNILHLPKQDHIMKTTEVSLSYDPRTRSRGRAMDSVRFDAQPPPTRNS
ncbi:hypothetical protein MMC16_004965 [Acarospora aff. strigata]|nr:hypothetical protein [Acarospora aff. strigata]